MEKLRVFIAIDVEDPLLVGNISRVMDSIISTGAPVKMVEPGNLHITIRFIGEVSRASAQEIIERVMKPLSFEEFPISFKGVGAFPSILKPRVVWIGVSEGVERLRAIRGAVERSLRSLGYPPEGRDFHPHLTLARVKGSRNLQALAKLIAQYEAEDFGSLTVREVKLKKSTLTPKGPIYEDLWVVRAR